MSEHIIGDLAQLEALYGEVGEAATLKETSYLHPHYAAIIKASPFAVLARLARAASMHRRVATRPALSRLPTRTPC